MSSPSRREMVPGGCGGGEGEGSSSTLGMGVVEG